ncbi:MAG: EamA family transporter [Campylobacterota bacterium]
MQKGIVLVLLSVFLQSFTFLCIKISTTSSELFQAIWLGSAFILIANRAFIWQYVLKYMPLSKAYPYNSLVQILIFVYAVVFFHEKFEVNHLFGLILMVFGIYILSQSKKP